MLNSYTSVISLPGSQNQQIHSDGGHLFGESIGASLPLMQLQSQSPLLISTKNVALLRFGGEAISRDCLPSKIRMALCCLLQLLSLGLVTFICLINCSSILVWPLIQVLLDQFCILFSVSLGG